MPSFATPTTLFCKKIDAPSGLPGPLWLFSTPKAVVRVAFANDPLPPHIPGEPPILSLAASQLTEALSGRRIQFDLPLLPLGTLFQLRVWEALRTIPYGETRTYADIARAIGHPKAFQAVGTAVGANPCAIIIPCHRVIPASGRLGGFRAGLAWKQYLLALERPTSSSS